MPARQSKKWCFTHNNYTEADVMKYEDLNDHAQYLEYLIAGREVAPTTGTLHLQGFAYFARPVTKTFVIGLFPGCHVELAVASAQKAIDYCRKEDVDPIECGDPPKTKGTGNQDRWKKARIAAACGRMADIPDDIYCKYINNFRAIHAESQKMPEPLVSTGHLWIYGKTGTGKSHAVATAYPDRYIKNLNKWWDGYTGQYVVHIDEIDPSHKYLTSFLKQWADKWPFNAEVKGSSKMLRPKCLIITSNYSIDEMEFAVNDYDAIKRRFKEIEKFRDQDLLLVRG